MRTYSQYTQLNSNKDFLQSHNYKQVKQWDSNIHNKSMKTLVFFQILNQKFKTNLNTYFSCSNVILKIPKSGFEI